MNEKKEEVKELEKKENPIKCPPNLEAVYDPQTGAFIGRKPIEMKEVPAPMKDKSKEAEDLIRSKSTMKMPDNFEAFYDPETNAYLGRRPKKPNDKLEDLSNNRDE